MNLFKPNVDKLKEKRNVKKLIKALNYKDSTVGCNAAVALGEIGDRQAVEPLIACLKSSNSYIRFNAFNALGAIGDNRAVEPLIDCLGIFQTPKLEIVSVLSQFGKVAVPGLIARLNHSELPVRFQSAEILGNIGDAQAVEALIGCLNDERVVRENTIEALRKIGSPAVEPLISCLTSEDMLSRHGAVKTLGQIGDSRAVEPLKDCLADATLHTPKVVIDALFNLGEAAYPSLLDYMKNADAALHQSIANRLSATSWKPKTLEQKVVLAIACHDWTKCKTFDESAIPILLPYLKDGDAEIRENVLNVLAAKPSLPSIEVDLSPFSQFIKNKKPNVRSNAASVLGKIGDPRALKILLTRLPNEKKVRSAIIEALGDLGEPGAIEALVPCLSDKSSSIRNKAGVALKKLGWKPDTPEQAADFAVFHEDWEECVSIGEPAVPALVQRLVNNNWGNQEVISTLKKIGGASEPLLVEYLTSDNEQARRNVGEALMVLGWVPDTPEGTLNYAVARGEWQECLPLGEAAVPVLLKYLDDNDYRQQSAIIQVLGEIGDARAIKPLMQRIDKTSRIRDVAAQALTNIGEPAVPIIVEVLAKREEEVLNTYITILGNIGDAEATLALAPYVGSFWYHTKRAALAALRRFGDAAIDILVEGLDHKDPKVSSDCARALDKLDWEPQTQEMEIKYAIDSHDWYTLTRIGEPAVPALIDLLQTLLANIIDPVVKTLTSIGEPALPALIDALNRKDAILRLNIVKALFAIDQSQTEDLVLPILIECLRNSGEVLRMNSTHYIERIGAPKALSAVPALIDALNDESYYVRRSAAIVLGNLGDVRAVEPLRSMPANEIKEVRESVAVALQKLGSAQPVASPVDQAIAELRDLLPSALSISADRIKEAQRDLAHKWEGDPMVSGSMEEILAVTRRHLKESRSSQIQAQVSYPDQCVSIMAMAGTTQQGGRTYQTANAYRIWRNEDTYYFYGSV